ncbi:MAG TPA: TlpA disulfide reductase family protein [Desulfuromonadaceae bacterium]
MKKCLSLLAVMVVFAVMTACNRNQVNKAAMPVENSPAPEVVVNSLQGAPLKLSDLKGKVVLLNFWATWCPPCRSEIPSMMKLNAAMAGKPFQMVAISIDEGGRPAIESFFQTSGFTLPTYIDPDNRAAKTYGITGVPETFVIDKQGVIVKKVIGPLEWDSPEVAAFLEQLMKQG